MLLLLIVRSPGRGMSRQNGMCKVLFRVWTALCLWETCDIVIKAGGRGIKLRSVHVLSQRPYGIIVKSSGQGTEAVLGLFFFFLRSALVHIHRGLELSQCSSRSD